MEIICLKTDTDTDTNLYLPTYKQIYLYLHVLTQTHTVQAVSDKKKGQSSGLNQGYSQQKYRLEMLDK